MCPEPPPAPHSRQQILRGEDWGGQRRYIDGTRCRRELLLAFRDRDDKTVWCHFDSKKGHNRQLEQVVHVA